MAHSPAPPAWAPTLEDVGGAIAHRTANVNVPGDGELLRTFTADTRPTGAEVTEMINFTCEEVSNLVPNVIQKIEGLAESAVKWRVAADIELAYAERSADANLYKDLDARAKYALELMHAAYHEHAATSPAEEPLPYWSFPDAKSYGDRSDI